MDDPRRRIDLPGSSQKVTQGEVWDWFGKNMKSNGKIKSLELKWNKAAGRFESGKLQLRDAASPDESPARTINDTSRTRRAYGRNFLSCPFLYYHEGALTFDPGAGATMDDRVYRLGPRSSSWSTVTMTRANRSKSWI